MTLLPCPFCGGSVDLVQHHSPSFRVVCSWCDSCGGRGASGDEAAEKWNRRASYAADLSAAQAEVERLRGELAEAEARAERAEAERDAALLATDKAVAAALEARAEDLDAKADAAFTAAVKAAEAGDEEREDAESARWTACP